MVYARFCSGRNSAHGARCRSSKMHRYRRCHGLVLVGVEPKAEWVGFKRGFLANCCMLRLEKHSQSDQLQHRWALILLGSSCQGVRSSGRITLEALSMEPIYDNIGINYSVSHGTDPKIAKQLFAELQGATRIQISAPEQDPMNLGLKTWLPLNHHRR